MLYSICLFILLLGRLLFTRVIFPSVTFLWASVSNPCEECKLKEEVLKHKENSLNDKEKLLDSKSQQIKKFLTRITKIAKEKAILKRKYSKVMIQKTETN